MTVHFQSDYAAALPDLCLDWTSADCPDPRILKYNEALGGLLGMDRPEARLLSGHDLPPGTRPVAQAYAGHQFGGFSPRLGDGRALLLGEVRGTDGALRDVALKGSGATPFSRGADGRAALGPVLREYLMGEAMAALNIPTTRALAALTTGEDVWREEGALPGAILVRVAASHLRVGTFQYAAAQGDLEQVRRLADYAIARHYPDLAGDYAGFFAAVAGRQARLIAQWMLVGFVHGVMNTDNMTISGQTIDYGPCAFMEAYAPGTVFSSIDRQGRYAYGNQPLILGWNLARLAETLLPLIDADEGRAVERATRILEGVAGQYQDAWLEGMRSKLGLDGTDPGDRDLAEAFLVGIEGADWTLCFRRLSRAIDDPSALRVLLAGADRLDDWLPRWRARLARDAAQRMEAANPLYIPRNERVEEALAAAHEGDMGPFDALLAAVSAPFHERGGLEKYALPASEGFGTYRTFCGT
ncbi:protein adenylyltransferase SelO [Falsirhodobacter algicola]|uniref:Protein nucleotidyltransferase YdiU n=1 Tax=Falsirhodobacter algicola TaxID=2692330 RepID=A0A8J8SLX5_9RHOB|nr:YdiU family protein [Falsirhodobacter algicola]QUS36836.1 YdiU family protein [Falsirhodobacter algicola]